MYSCFAYMFTNGQKCQPVRQTLSAIRQEELTKVDRPLLCKQKANCHERQNDCTAVVIKAARASEEATHILSQAGTREVEKRFFDITLKQRRLKKWNSASLTWCCSLAVILWMFIHGASLTYVAIKIKKKKLAWLSRAWVSSFFHSPCLVRTTTSGDAFGQHPPVGGVAF